MQEESYVGSFKNLPVSRTAQLSQQLELSCAASAEISPSTSQITLLLKS